MKRDNGAVRGVVLVGVLGMLALNGAANLVLDRQGRWALAHTVFEVVSILVAMTVAAFLWLGWRHSARVAGVARRSLESRQAERDAWREKAQRALEGLGKAIDGQFDQWSLTPTEREIALLLLKGYTHKRIANLTHRRERTVRQHAVTVYQKSELAGRAELAAFFLEDLMVPRAVHEHVARPT